MARGYQRLRSFIDEEEDKKKKKGRQAAFSGTDDSDTEEDSSLDWLRETSPDDDTPANRESKTAPYELAETGSTNYRGKEYNLPAGTLPNRQKRLNAATAGASQNVAKLAELALGTAKDRDDDWWQQRRNERSARASQDVARMSRDILKEKKEQESRSGLRLPEIPKRTNGLNPGIEAEFQRRNGAQGPNAAPGAWAQSQIAEANRRDRQRDRYFDQTESGWKNVGTTLGGMAANLESKWGGEPLIAMARIMEMPDDLLYRITGNERFNLDREPGLRDSAALRAADPFAEEAERASEKVGDLGKQLIQTAGAAGSMIGWSGFLGPAFQALGNAGTLARLSNVAESSPLLTSAASRRGAKIALDVLTNPGNFGISLGSAVNSYDKAYAEGANFGQAVANGLYNGLAEYMSNKLFSGTPLEDNPGEKGYVTRLVESITKDTPLEKVLVAFNKSTGGKLFNWAMDKAGEGLEEVITGIADPLIEKLTYNWNADLATAKDLVDEFAGGVLLSLLMSGGEAVMNRITENGAVEKSRVIKELVAMGVDRATANRYAKQITDAGSAVLDGSGWLNGEYNDKARELMGNADYAEKSQGKQETADKAEGSDSESLNRYAEIYYRENAVDELRRGAEPASVSEAAYLNELEARNYFYIWESQGPKAADAYYDSTVRAAVQNRQARAEAEYQARRQAEEQARAQAEEETRRQAEQATQDTQEAAQERTGPPLPSGMQQATETRTETAESKPTPRANLTIGAAQERSGNLWTAQRTRENAPMLEAIRTANEDLLSSYMTAEAQGNSDTAVIDAVNAVWQNVKQGDTSPMAGAELLNKMWAAGKDDAARNMYLKSIIDNDGNLRAAALNAARSIDAEHRNGGLRIGQQTDIAAEAAAAAAENAAAEEAGNDLDYGGRGRVSGQRAGEQAGRVAGGKQALTQPGKAIGRRADAKNLRAEEVDARDHIAEAAKGSKITIAPEQMVQQDKELRAVAKRLEAITGKKVYYTIGNIRYRGADGKINNARGAITEDGIYLRCDHNDLTVTQIGAHELYHYYEQQFPGLSARMKEKIIEWYSAEEFNKVAQVYIEKLGGICGLTENMDAQAREEALARVEAEIFADAFGNINYFGSGVTKFTDLVRGEVNATAGMENAAATQRKTGPPETRFSTQEEEKGENNDRGRGLQAVSQVLSTPTENNERERRSAADRRGSGEKGTLCFGEAQEYGSYSKEERTEVNKLLERLIEASPIAEKESEVSKESQYLSLYEAVQYDSLLVEKLLNEGLEAREAFFELENQVEDFSNGKDGRLQEVRQSYTDDFVSRVTSKAEQYFGTTDNFDDAGYIDTNGNLLDFQKDTKHPINHREVYEILDALHGVIGRESGMYEFLNMGNIRMTDEGLELSKKPNVKQRAAIREYVEHYSEGFSVDFADENGKTVGTIDYENARAAKVLADIDAYFKDGTIRKQSDTARFHTQFSTDEDTDADYMDAVNRGDMETALALTGQEGAYDGRTDGRGEALAGNAGQGVRDGYGNVQGVGGRTEAAPLAGYDWYNNDVEKGRKARLISEYSTDAGINETRFSTDEDTDADYMAAVNSGDLETAQRMEPTEQAGKPRKDETAWQAFLNRYEREAAEQFRIHAAGPKNRDTIWMQCLRRYEEEQRRREARKSAEIPGDVPEEHAQLPV